VTEPQQDKRPDRSSTPASASVEPATPSWSGEPARAPALAGLAQGEGPRRPAAADPPELRRLHDEPPPRVAPIAALRRVADRHAEGLVIRRRWGKRKRGEVQPWEQVLPTDAPTGMYARDNGYTHLPEAQRPWRGGDGLLYQNVDGGPGPLFGAGALAAAAAAPAPALAPAFAAASASAMGASAMAASAMGSSAMGSAAAASPTASDSAIDPASGELAKRPRRVGPETKAAPSFTLATFDGLVRPPRTGDPRYKHASMPARLTPEMALAAQTQAGKRTAEYLVATQDGGGNLAEAGINRDHFISNFNIARLVRAIVPYLRGAAGADDAPFRAWTRALVGGDAGYQAKVDAALDTALTTGADGKLITLLAQASNNMVFGQAEANQHTGHGMDVPRYRGRIAPYAQAILDATTSLTSLVALTADPRAVLDAISQSMDTATGSYVSSSTPIGEEESYRRPVVSDDLGLGFYSSSRVPLGRSTSTFGRLQHRRGGPSSGAAAASPAPAASALLPASPSPAVSASAGPSSFASAMPATSMAPLIQLTAPPAPSGPALGLPTASPFASPLAASALSLSPVSPPAASALSLAPTSDVAASSALSMSSMSDVAAPSALSMSDVAASALSLSPVSPPAASALSLTPMAPSSAFGGAGPAPGAGGPAPGAGGPRRLLQLRAFRALDVLRDRWRAQVGQPAGVPPGYRDFREVIQSIDLAPAHVGIPEIEGQARQWLQSAGSRWGL